MAGLVLGCSKQAALTPQHPFYYAGILSFKHSFVKDKAPPSHAPTRKLQQGCCGVTARGQDEDEGGDGGGVGVACAQVECWGLHIPAGQGC